MSKKPKRPSVKLPKADELHAILANALNNFEGQVDELESAMGMLYMGHAFGWKALYIVHTIATVRKYEKILGIVAKDVFPEHTEHSDRVLGYRVLDKVSNFWKTVKGEITVEGFRDRKVVRD
ncbi:MAG: hypothetical protein V4709_12280 [Pseudomonadota bacterium]